MQSIFVGRQAIYQRDLTVYGYELLYRESDSGGYPLHVDGDTASSRVLLNAFTEIGIERLVGRSRAFINLSHQFFVEQPPIPFDRESIVLEILEDSPVDPPLIEAARSLHQQGYRLALDDYAGEARWEPLLPYVSIIKFEVAAMQLAGMEQLVDQLHARGITLLAEKIETPEQFEELSSLGFDLFQGYLLGRPSVVSQQSLGSNQLVLLQLLSAINDPDISTEELQQLIRQDAGLSYKVLRYLNSAALALPRKVDSIAQGVLFLGLDKLRSWVNLMAMANSDARSPELFTLALTRAHLGELLLKKGGSEDPTSGFTVGLLSILDLLLQRLMELLLQQLPLSEKLSHALLIHQGEAGEALECALALENAEWDSVSFAQLPAEQIQELYFQASERAFNEQSAISG